MNGNTEADGESSTDTSNSKTDVFRPEGVTPGGKKETCITCSETAVITRTFGTAKVGLCQKHYIKLCEGDPETCQAALNAVKNGLPGTVVFA